MKTSLVEFWENFKYQKLPSKRVQLWLPPKTFLSDIKKFLRYSLWVIFLPFRDAFSREFCPKLKDIFVPLGLDHDFNFIEEPNFKNKCDFTRSENVTKLKINETLPTGLNFTGYQNHDFLRIDLLFWHLDIALKLG